MDQSVSRINNSELTEFNAEKLHDKLIVDEPSVQEDKTEFNTFSRNYENSELRDTSLYEANNEKNYNYSC